MAALRQLLSERDEIDGTLPIPEGHDGGVDPLNPGKCLGGTGGHGLGGDYKLYRFYQKGGFDEELQIWTWNQSYATQYRDVTASGTDPQHQAWSFGGNYTAAASIVPALGTVNYVGQWGATAKTSNFDDLPHPYVLAPLVVPVTGIGKTMSYNNNWRVQGTSALTANFSTMAFSGTLTPLFWQGVDQNQALSTVDVANAVANGNACKTGSGACDVTTFAGAAVFNNWQNFNAAYMTSNVKLQGTITKDATNAAKPNQIVGTASMDTAKGWTTTAGTNPLYGGFFGNTAQEVTGAFGLDAVIAGPNDGFYPINNDRRAFIQMSGIFNGQ